MAKPVVLLVDDEPQVLNAVERDLRTHFKDEYRVLKAGSGQEALEAIRGLKRRGTPVALFLVDQRMPVMNGTQFLEKAIEVYPDARKVLLTAYADTQAAITSINDIGLDHYLMKPWDPPEENLYPVLDELLSDWKATVDLPYDGIRVAGTLWSATSHTAKDFLSRNQIPYQWLDIEKDPQAQQMVDDANKGDHRLPVIFYPDGSFQVQPNLRELADKVGLQTRAAKPFYDLAIIGAGPAGLAAAVYGASEGLKTVMFEREAAGGQAGTSSRIENYLGFPNGLSGADLARRAVAQARRFGVEILTTEDVSDIRVDGPYKYIKMAGGEEISCHSMVIASGVSVRRLESPGVSDLTGAGVYYGAALTEAAFYRDMDVFIVGGANSAGQAAVYFSRFAKTVTILVHSSTIEIGMSHYLVEQIGAIPNIHVLVNSDVVEARGDGRLQELCVMDREAGTTTVFPASAMFIFIGAVPRTEMVADLVERDTSGFIYTGPDLYREGQWSPKWPLKREPYILETSQPGVFAAGDVRHGSIKRIATAVGEGSMTVALVHQYLRTV